MTQDEAHSVPEFVITRHFAAPRTHVWAAWTQPAEISRWFGPKGCAASVKAFELRPGGIAHTSLTNPDGSVVWGRFLYRDIVPQSRLVWEHSFADEHAQIVRAPFADGNWPLRLLTRVAFVEAGDGTLVTLTWTPLEASAIECATFAAMMGSMDQGWSGSFEALDGVLAAA